MKTTFFIAIFFSTIALVFFACDSKKAEKTAEAAPKAAEKTLKKAAAPAKSFYQTWMHSREEDKDGLNNYRPTDGSFQFPPSRGRYGYVFEKDGKGSMTYPGPTDATAFKPLTWSIMEHAGARLLTLKIQESKEESTTKVYIIHQMDDKLLQVSEFTK
jgi:hypothetical protein